MLSVGLFLPVLGWSVQIMHTMDMFLIGQFLAILEAMLSQLLSALAMALVTYEMFFKIA